MLQFSNELSWMRSFFPALFPAPEAIGHGRVEHLGVVLGIAVGINGIKQQYGKTHTEIQKDTVEAAEEKKDSDDQVGEKYDYYTTADNLTLCALFVLFVIFNVAYAVCYVYMN